MDKRLVFDTVPVRVTLEKLRCRDYDSVRDFRFRPMRKEDLPKRYHFVNNIRIEEIVFDNAVNFYLTEYVHTIGFLMARSALSLVQIGRAVTPCNSIV